MRGRRVGLPVQCQWPGSTEGPRFCMSCHKMLLVPLSRPKHERQ